VKPTVEAYTVALPWYEPEDFQLLWELARDHDDIAPDYEVWRSAALAVINAWLARGRALQIVTIRPKEFLAWLEASDLPNTAATRRKYVEEKAQQSGSEAGQIAMPAEAMPG
jgi:hypothetical protein